MLIRKLILLLFPILIANSAFAVELSMADTIPQKLADLPFHGNIQKTPEILEADNEFKATVIKSAGTAQKGSEYFSNKAWTAFQEQKLNSAMKFANQSWLLNNNNYSAYWVMALIETFRGAPDNEVEALYKKALSQVDTANESRLKQDYQTFLNEGSDHHVDNLQQIAEEYAKTRIKIISNYKQMHNR